MFRKKTFWVSNIPWGVMPGIWPLCGDSINFRSEWIVSRSAKKAYRNAVRMGFFNKGEYVRVHKEDREGIIGAFVVEFNTQY